jgi:hypothetical protein
LRRVARKNPDGGELWFPQDGLNILDMKERWNPSGCVYTYIIAESGEDNYLIMTENEYGFRDYQFRKGDVPNYTYAKFWITQEGE